MATPKSAPPSLLFIAVFSQSESAIATSARLCEEQWGRIALSSNSFEHNETAYYQREMGRDLRKQFFVFESVFDPARLIERKLESNRIEQAIAQGANYDVLRPVNVDPGYVTLTKLVLASAKDRAHRIYLDHGIYAEECLYYLGGAWHSRPWTYPDYQRSDFQEFFSDARELLKSRLRSQ